MPLQGKICDAWARAMQVCRGAHACLSYRAGAAGFRRLALLTACISTQNVEAELPQKKILPIRGVEGGVPSGVMTTCGSEGNDVSEDEISTHGVRVQSKYRCRHECMAGRQACQQGCQQ